MSADELLAGLESRAIKLQPYCGGLRATGQTRQLTEELKAALKVHKLELMVRLGHEQSPRLRLRDQLATAIDGAALGTDLDAVADDIRAAYGRGHLTEKDFESLTLAAAEKKPQLSCRCENMPLSDFATSGLVREVHSKALGERVLWAADNAVVPPGASLVVYRATELIAVRGISPQRLWAIHTVKKVLDGEIVPADVEGDDIPVRDLLDESSGATACYTCGQNRWWDNDGRRMCAVCHPPMRKSGKPGTGTRPMESRGKVSER